MCLALLNTVLTWYVGKKKSWSGPSRCFLYKVDEENNPHLLMFCDYSVQVWKELEGYLGFRNMWSGNSLEECLQGWCNNPLVKKYREFPLIVVWGIWLVRNSRDFEDRNILPIQAVSQSLSILNFFKQSM